MNDTTSETTPSSDSAKRPSASPNPELGVTQPRAPYWPFVIARAVPAAVIAAIITFSADHSVFLGLVLFAIFTATTGIIVGVGGAVAAHSPVTRALWIGHGLIGILSALGAAVSVSVSPSPASGTLVALVCVYAGISGCLELYSGVRAGRARNKTDETASRDGVFIGAITAVLAITVLLVPLSLRVPIRGQHGVEGFLTAPVVVVGLFGAYCAIIAVYLVIAGLSLKWAPTTSAASAAERVR